MPNPTEPGGAGWVEEEAKRLCGCQECTHRPPRDCEWRKELAAAMRIGWNRAIANTDKAVLDVVNRISDETAETEEDDRRLMWRGAGAMDALKAIRALKGDDEV